MKIAIVVPYFTPYVRGNEFGLAYGLSRLGVDVTVLASTGKAPREKMIADNKDVCQSLGFKVKYLNTVFDVGEIPLVPSIGREIGSGGYDAVLLQEDYQLICHMAYLAAHRKKMPTVLSTERTYFPAGGKRLALGLFDATLNRMVRRGATAYTAHCTAAKEFAEKKLKVPAGRIRVINVGVDTSLFKPSSGETPLKDGDLKILTVARLHPYKGLEYLIKAMEAVRKNRPGAVLYIMGRGASAQDLKALASKMGLDDAVRFVETPVPNYEMPPIYSSADIYVQPSVIEPYGIAVLEAMACGKPTICARVGGMMDTVDDHTTGRLVNPADPLALSDAIIELSGDPKAAEAMGRRARERAVENFDWLVIARKYKELLDEIAGR
jgi:glycosyltransferase involved in cell wall biosynthesis